MHRFIRLLIVSPALAMGCARTSAPPAERPGPTVDLPRSAVELPLQYDGVYQSQDSFPMEFNHGFIPTWNYLRFYPDGTVVTMGTPGRPHELGFISRANESLPAGTVTYRNGLLSFSAREGVNAAVDYAGEVVDGRLHLRIHSHINGYRSEMVYVFRRGAAGIPPDTTRVPSQ